MALQSKTPLTQEILRGLGVPGKVLLTPFRVGIGAQTESVSCAVAAPEVSAVIRVRMS